MDKNMHDIAEEMIENGAIVIHNGTTVYDWLFEGDIEYIESKTIAELVEEWNEDLV